MKVGLIFPHQLFEKHPVIAHSQQQYLVSDALIIGGDKEWPLKPHAKKLIMHIASLEYYVQRYQLERVDCYSEISLDGVEEIVVCRLVDDVLQRRLVEFCDLNGVVLTELDTPAFVTPREWGRRFFASSNKPFMKTFYEAQRLRMNVLIDVDGKPEGGRWSYDDENRKKFPVRATPPDEPAYKHSQEERNFLKKAEDELADSQHSYYGNTEGFRYPVTHEGARKWLGVFLEERFSQFGTYEDAITGRSTFLYHSVLTPMLNMGLLDPKEIVEKALAVAHEKNIKINHTEGFVRQIIGWREYMALMYEKHGRFLRTQNFWKFTDKMPKSIYLLRTGIPPVDDVLHKVNQEGYAHHIERLMIIGNFFMLLRIKPDDVFQWFSEMFIDAYDWVMVPNIYGMSQFSDGGLLVTKPYISGSNYIRKMSDYKAGAWSEVWDALFWTFIDCHRDYFAKQYRMIMMLSHLNKMGNDKLTQYHKTTEEYRAKLQNGGFLGDDNIEQMKFQR